MENTNHTPGPWFANRTAPCWEVRGGGKPLAYLPKHSAEIANARLIAAAPEMLEKLEAAEPFLKRFAEHTMEQFGTDAGLGKLVTEIQQLIVKTKG
jgi:hypothetical protein